MIKKLFIKDHKNTSNNKVKISYGILSGIIGIIINLLLGISKLILGILSGSITIISDCFNNLTDMTSSILTIISFKLSNKNINKYRPYIYSKYEFISSMIISIIMFSLGTIFLIKSIYKIINPEYIIINYITYIILFISLVLKTIQYFILKDFYASTESKTLKMTCLETRNDIITSISILVSMIIMKVFNINIDGYLGLIVATFIIFTNLENIIDETKYMSFDNNIIEEIKVLLLKEKYISQINNIIIHKYINNTYITLNALITNDNNIYKNINVLEKNIKDIFNINLTIHIDLKKESY